MKLIYCNKCRDVIRLIQENWRKCYCGKSGGQYNDDLVTATVGGSCKVFGIANPFFSKEFQKAKNKQYVRWKYGYGYESTDIWYGEYKNDTQVFRIKSPNGPKLKMRINKLNSKQNGIWINDDRKFRIGGKELYYVVVDRIKKSSFKGKK